MIFIKITKLSARQVLDSRGNPTVEVTAFSGNISESAMVPSGASTGKYEAVELRDDSIEFFGKGVKKAVFNIKKIERRIKGMDVRYQEKIDGAMLELDGTKNKSKLGANAILGVSMACARLSARLQSKPLYKVIAKLAKTPKVCMPVPFANVINGGKHAGNELQMQEFMIVPVKARDFEHATRVVSETYHVLKGIIEKKYGKSATGVGDEGGFAPPVKTASEALSLIVRAIRKSGYEDILSIAMDPAASEFYQDGRYRIERNLTSKGMASYYEKLVEKYPIISI